ncbi:MAG: flavodoxin family protein [Dehalococcoidia bacterium]
MTSYVVYDSQFGNTRQLAQVIGDKLATAGAVQVIPTAESTPVPADVDLLIIGGPTHAHGASAGMKALLNALGSGSLEGVPAAAFDTRFHIARWLSGSAAGVIAKRLRKAGCELVMPPESFFVSRDEEPVLLSGEFDRARSWARAVLAAVPSAVVKA